MPTYINTVHCKLIGLCTLQGEARQRVRQEWDARFFEHDAFWLDVSCGQSAMDIVREVRKLIMAQGIMQVVDTAVVISVFTDLTQAPDCTLIKEINKVGELMENALGCFAPVTVQYGYLADAAFGDRDAMREFIRQNVEANLECGRLTPLYLISDMPLALPEDNQSWKAAIVMLDLLRRDTNPAELLHGGNPHGDIGFLRYGEYDERKRFTLQDHLQQVVRSLSQQGDIELQKQVVSACEALRQRIEEAFVPDPLAQPLHPDLKVNGKINQMLAAHKKYAPFEEAKASTLSALVMTGDRLQASIMEFCRPMIEQAAQDLTRFIEQAQVGVELEMDAARMESILSDGAYSAQNPYPPAFAYNPNGYMQEISMYLMSVRDHAVRFVIHSYRQALCEAYRSADPGRYEKKRSELMDIKGRIETRLGSVMDKEAFVTLAVSDKPLPMTCFYPMIQGGFTQSWILSRTQQDADKLDEKTHQGVYCIDEKYGGLKHIDNAPIKALEALLFDCDENRLKDLM